MIDMVKTTHNFPTSCVSNSKRSVLKCALWTLCHQVQGVVWGDSWTGNSVAIDKDRTSVSEVHHDLNHDELSLLQHLRISRVWMWLTEVSKDFGHSGNLEKVKIESMNLNSEEVKSEIFLTQHTIWPYKNKCPKYYSAWQGANVVFWIIFVGCMSILTMIY